MGENTKIAWCDATCAELAIKALERISQLEHTGACDPDDPPQEDCGICIAEQALRQIRELGNWEDNIAAHAKDSHELHQMEQELRSGG